MEYLTPADQGEQAEYLWLDLNWHVEVLDDGVDAEGDGS